MSRRIAISALATCAALITTPAFADRECFEASCSADAQRMPDVTEPPPPVTAMPEPVEMPAPAQAPVIDAVPPAMVERNDQTAPRAHAASPAPRPAVQAGSDRFTTTRMPDRVTRDMPRYEEEPQGPIRVAHQGASAPVQATAYANQAAAYGSKVVVVVGPGTYEDGVTPAYAHLRPDPTFKPCQVDARAPRGQYIYCGPYSYHAYGANGYRPMGTYQAYRAQPGYIAPDARIISIDTAD